MTAVTDQRVGSGYATCAVGRIIVFAWTDVPTIDGAVAMTSVFDRVHGNSGQLGMLIMISHKAGRLMPAPVRDQLTKLMKRYAPDVRAVAYLFEGTGFESTIVRSVITAMNMVSRPTYWVSVFADRNRAVTALLAQMDEGSSGTREDVLAAIDGLMENPQPATHSHSL
jgi:hypothetical protein